MDSTVLAKFITTYKLKFKGVFFKGNHIAMYEKEWANGIFKDICLDYSEFEINLLHIKEVKENKKTRCYYCKKHLFSRIKQKFPDKIIIEGSHIDDTKEYRPGMNAIEEMKVFSPFKMIEMSKDEIRLLGYKLGLPVNKFPSRPCLLTRFPYNTKINPKILDVINRAESYILRTGLKNFRIRIMDGEYKLHILDREREIFEKKQTIVMKYLKALNLNITIDFMENLSGFFDL
ncbi:hypothetical protein JCM13304A_00750 [Desulfothermus okinawensis JCM 13304]